MGQFHPDSVLVPAACYNFVDDFENDNDSTGIQPLEPLGPNNNEVGTFIPAEDLCLNSNNKHYSMSADQGLQVDNGSLLDQSNYTIELLFRIDDIPASNPDGTVLIMNFANQSGKGSLIIDENGFVCIDDGSGNRTCGTDKVSPNYPDDVPTEWINLAFAFNERE
ncbi:hypothetical protein [Marivirga tractuosa]|uniref:hypothetical protein n=1 Tax=Marivirga tractuosa TaxID=1006 RepID=UPI0002F008E8|nr:hypothetical protein [Marivirga tractuosa]